MRYILSIGFLLFSIGAFSQANHTIDSLYRTDSVRQNLLIKLDSLSQLDLLAKQSDSLRQIWESKLDNLNNVDPGHHTLNSLQIHYRLRIDSLKALDLPYEKYLVKLDSISNLPNQKISRKIKEWQEQGEEKLKSLQDNVKGKTSIDIAGPKEEMPLKEANLPDAEMPAVTKKVNMEELDPGLELPREHVDTGKLTRELNLDKIQQEAGEIQDIPTRKIEKAKEATHISDISNELDRINEINSKGEQYIKETQAVKEGDFTRVEEKAREEITNNFDEVAGLEEHKGAFEQAKQEHEEYLKLQQEYLKQARQYSDPGFVKQRIREKSKYVANQKLAEYKSQVEKAQKDLLNLKIDSPKAVVAIPTAAEWPLRERVMLGINLEPMRDEVTQLDLAPYVGFMLNDKWHVYGSFMYRARFANDRSRLELNNPIYGPRIATTYRFFKGFYTRCSWEQIRTNLPATGKRDEIPRDWVYGVYAGLGKQYNITKHVKGTLQLMYNFLHNEKSPYARTFNIRIGFEVDLKKRITRKDIIKEIERKNKIKRILDALKR